MTATRRLPRVVLLALLLAMFGLLLNEPARAADDAGIASIGSLKAAALRHVAAQVPATATLSADGLDARLRMPACAEPLAASTATPARNGAWTIRVACPANGSVLWSILVPVRVADLRPVVVATRVLTPNQPIPADALRVETRDVSRIALGHLATPDQAIGQMPRRPIAPGSVLSPDALTAPSVIRRGAVVAIIGRVGTLEVRAQGKALADGGSGERIAIENLSSRRVVHGTVRDAGTVEVGL